MEQCSAKQSREREGGSELRWFISAVTVTGLRDTHISRGSRHFRHVSQGWSRRD